MALRLRRGTDAERLIMTPPEAGELIYTTDTKAVYVGDGTTVGGLPVSGQALGIDDLGNVTVTAPNDGDILKWNGSAWINTPQESLEKPGNIYGTDSTLLIDTDNSVIVGPIVANTAIVGDLIGDVTGNADGDHTGTFTGTVTGNVIGALDGDVTGSVFSDDSSVIVDAIDRSITADRVTATDIFTGALITNSFNSITVKPTNTAQINTLTVEAIDQQAKINIRRSSDSNIIGSDYDTDGSGGVIWTRVGLDGDQLIGGMFGYENALAIFSNDTSNNFPESHHIIWRDGKLGVGVFFPSESLETSGNAVVNGFVQFGSLTTTERDALTAANGMVIYNSTDNKFQGYENGAWVNLV